MTSHQYQVVSVHFSAECDLQCPFCYRNTQTSRGEKPRQFFLDLVPVLKEITPQVALGGGEPLLDTAFVSEFASRCTKHGLMCNFTTNGKRFLEMSDSEITQVLRDVTLVSISYDSFKWGGDTEGFSRLIKRLREIVQVCNLNPPGRKSDVIFPQIGVNLLVDQSLFDKKGIPFYMLVQWLFKTVGVDRVFTLYPKNQGRLKIREHRWIYDKLTTLYPQFYVDDLTKLVLEEGYSCWESCCQAGQSILSIDEEGKVYRCSFDSNPVLELTEPSELLKIREITLPKRFNCPYLREEL